MEDEQQDLWDIPIEGEKKIVVVGHNGCGKTSLVASFVHECPVAMTEIDKRDIRKTISFGREKVEVVLREESLEPQCTLIDRMAGTDAALVCFSFNDARSIGSVPGWIDLMSQYWPDADVFVVGCKLDLKHKTAVCARSWRNLERIIIRHNYLECSAKTGEDVSHMVRVVGAALLSQQLRGNPAVRD